MVVDVLVAVERVVAVVLGLVSLGDGVFTIVTPVSLGVTMTTTVPGVTALIVVGVVLVVDVVGVVTGVVGRCFSDSMVLTSVPSASTPMASASIRFTID